MGVRADVYTACGMMLGQSRNVGPDGTDNTSLRIKAVYDRQARIFLEAHPWNFASEIEQLTASEPTPDDWDYGFPKPSKCRRIIKVDDQADMERRPDIDYAVRKNRILTNSDTTWLKYVDGAYADLEGSWPEHCIDALAARIAHHIAKPFDTSESEMTRLAKQARREMSRARLYDGQQEKVYEPPLSVWQATRLSKGKSGKNG